MNGPYWIKLGQKLINLDDVREFSRTEIWTTDPDVKHEKVEAVKVHYKESGRTSENFYETIEQVQEKIKNIYPMFSIDPITGKSRILRENNVPQYSGEMKLSGMNDDVILIAKTGQFHIKATSITFEPIIKEPGTMPGSPPTIEESIFTIHARDHYFVPKPPATAPESRTDTGQLYEKRFQIYDVKTNERIAEFDTFSEAKAFCSEFFDKIEIRTRSQGLELFYDPYLLGFRRHGDEEIIENEPIHPKPPATAPESASE